jgi:predicted nucleotidyltransferase
MGARAASAAGATAGGQAIDHDLVRRFRRRLAERLRLERLLVFGSRARGTHRPHSDYDLIVVSPDFQGVSPLWRGHGLNRLWNDLAPGVDVELLCVTPDEFAQATSRPTSWLQQAAAEAVEV